MKLGSDGQAVVRAPMYMRDAEIARFVERHSGWLEKQLARRVPPVRFADGDRTEICGRSLTVVSAKRACIAEDTLCLPAEGREKALVSLLRKIAGERMKRLLDRYSRVGGFSYRGLKITSARTRWGSCNSDGGIAFSFRTAFLPDALAEYLAVHELSHTLRMDHSAAFWKIVEQYIPDYKSRRKALKGYHWAMECL